MSGLEAAVALAKLGMYVFAVHPLGPAVNAKGKLLQKTPYTKNGHLDATTDPDAIRAMWQRHPDALPAIWTGRSALVVHDGDKKNGKDWEQSLRDAGLELPPTPLVRPTPSGVHHYYAAPAGIAMPNGDTDVRYNGAKLVGNDRRSGSSYVVWYGKPITTLPALPAAPEWLIAAPAPHKAARGGQARGGDVATWRKRAKHRHPSDVATAAAQRVRRDNTSHADMFAAVGDVVREGSTRQIDRMRSKYVEKWPAYASDFDQAVRDQVAKFPLPPVTFKRSKTDLAQTRVVPLSEGAAILDEIERTLSRFVAFPTESHLHGVTLWAAFTHLIGVLDDAPRLWIHSPEPGSGKSRLLEVLAKLVRDSVKTVNTSTAYLARRIDDSSPTILLDEADTIFGRGIVNATTEELRGIINSGYRRGEYYRRASPTGSGKVELQEFHTFSPVALASLGDNMPDTIRTRSLMVPMRRRAPGEKVEPYRERVNGSELDALHARLAAWARTAEARIGNPWPELPESVVDRAADVWEPLISVADAAGGRWPAIAREIAVELVAEAENRPATVGVRLLADIRRVIGDRKRIPAAELLHSLTGLEDAPWADLAGKGAIDSRYLGRMFDGYGIPPSKAIRFGDNIGTAKGWERSAFVDAWARYLPENPKPPTTLPIEK